MDVLNARGGNDEAYISYNSRHALTAAVLKRKTVHHLGMQSYKENCTPSGNEASNARHLQLQIAVG